jgi:hypothetical protein
MPTATILPFQTPATKAPDARRASAPAPSRTPRCGTPLPAGWFDDFGLPAAEPILIADLLLALETMPWREPSVARRWTPCGSRVVVMIGEHRFALTPVDARLAAASLDHEQAFAGCSGVADQLRRAAIAAEVADAGDNDGGPVTESEGGGGSGARTLIGFGVVGGIMAAYIAATLIGTALGDVIGAIPVAG